MVSHNIIYKSSLPTSLRFLSVLLLSPPPHTGNDPYNPMEPNPLFSNALASSLWELNTQREHYHSAVSTLAKIFSEAFTKQAYSTEDFLDHTYATVSPPVATFRSHSHPPRADAHTHPMIMITVTVIAILIVVIVV